MVRRTVLYSSKGKKLYAVRDKSGQFKDIQQYSRAHAMDIKRGTTKSESAKATKSAKKTAKTSARKRPTKRRRRRPASRRRARPRRRR